MNICITELEKEIDKLIYGMYRAVGVNRNN